jgi:hypothetical protein
MNIQTVAFPDCPPSCSTCMQVGERGRAWLRVRVRVAEGAGAGVGVDVDVGEV